MLDSILGAIVDVLTPDGGDPEGMSWRKVRRAYRRSDSEAELAAALRAARTGIGPQGTRAPLFSVLTDSLRQGFSARTAVRRCRYAVDNLTLLNAAYEAAFEKHEGERLAALEDEFERYGLGGMGAEGSAVAGVPAIYSEALALGVRPEELVPMLHERGHTTPWLGQ